MTPVKELMFQENARQKLREGISRLAQVVSTTLGPTDRPLGIHKYRENPILTREGHTIVKDIEFKDQFINMGASIAKQTAAKMKERCGDGTTSTLVLLRAMVENSLKNAAAGANPISLKRGMEKSVEALLQQLTQLSKPVSELKEILPIAVWSASGDAEVGNLVAQALQRVGRGGIVTFEESKNLSSSIEMIDGIQFKGGYLSSYFCTNTEALLVELQEAAVLVTDMKIHSIQEILALLQTVAVNSQELLVIADDFQDDVLSALVINTLRGTLKVCAVKAPGVGNHRRDLLQDIAAFTGATVITQELGLSLKDTCSKVLGVIQKAVVSKETTTLMGGRTDHVEIQEHLKLIDGQLSMEKNKPEKARLQARKAQLYQKVAVIRIEAEMKHKKQLFENSLNGAQAALEEGVVPGGGVALLRACSNLKNPPLKGDELLGFHVVLQACQAPFRQIVKNAGHDSSLVLEDVQSKPQDWGFNALTEQVEDLSKSGIMDPCKIVQQSLVTALASATLILLSQLLIGYAPDENNRGWVSRK